MFVERLTRRLCTRSLTSLRYCGRGSHQLVVRILLPSWRPILILACFIALFLYAALPLIEQQRLRLVYPKLMCPDSSAESNNVAEGILLPHHQRVSFGNWSFRAPPHLDRICNGRSAKNPLLVIVPVTSTMVAERETLRQTWGAQLNSNIGKMLFLIQLPQGKPVAAILKTEFDLHRDLLLAFHQGKHGEDTYGLLVRKVVAGLNWYSQFCSMGFDYVLKADHDSYWNVPSLLRLLQRHRPSEPLVLGSVQEGAPVERNAASKFFIPLELYSKNQFPPYASGGPGYALSRAAAVAITEAAFRGTSGALWLEDVYVTGLLPMIAFPGCGETQSTVINQSVKQFMHLHSDYIFICRYTDFTSLMVYNWPPLAMHRVQEHSLRQLHAWMMAPGITERSNSQHSIVYSRSLC